MHTGHPPLADVLLVAGPSGAGKSTFIQQLSTGRLTPDVRALLPRGAEQWVPIEANLVLVRHIPLESIRSAATGAAGVIFHYDTLVIHRLGIGSYECDPVFTLLDGTTRITIVNIHPPPETLVLQYEARQHIKQYLKRVWKGRARLIWGKAVRTPLRVLGHWVGMARMVEPSHLYGDKAQIQRCYQEWDAFARRLVDGKPSARLLYVEPRQSFALVARS
jgi:hypothetical protein